MALEITTNQNDVSSSPLQQQEKRKSALEKVKHTYHIISYDKRVQRLLMISSVLLAIADLASDWSVVINYITRATNANTSRQERTIFTTYFGIFIFFLAFHGIFALAYHISQSKELRAQKQLTGANSNSNLNENNTNSTSITSTATNNNINTNTSKTDGNDVENVDLSKVVITETALWQYPFFLIGLGTVAAIGNCFKLGTTDQLWEENRYFEVLFEALPVGCITFYALLEQQDYSNQILVISIAISVLSVGYGTGWYFSRPLEFKPIVESTLLCMFVYASTQYRLIYIRLAHASI